MAPPERIHEGPHYEVIASVELARRWVLPLSWVRGHVRSRVTDPIPHIRFGRYVRFRWGSPGTRGLACGAHGQFGGFTQTNAITLTLGKELRPPHQINQLRLFETHRFFHAH